jgi:hypothetical protein
VANPPQDVRLTPNDALRFLLELFALFSLGLWGFSAWPLPWPGIAFGIGMPLAAAVLWGLFRSPKARFPLGIAGRVMVEVAVMGSAAAAWFAMDQPVVGALFAAVALVSGIINARAELAREAG